MQETYRYVLVYSERIPEQNIEFNADPRSNAPYLFALPKTIGANPNSRSPQKREKMRREWGHHHGKLMQCNSIYCKDLGQSYLSQLLLELPRRVEAIQSDDDR